MNHHFKKVELSDEPLTTTSRSQDRHQVPRRCCQDVHVSMRSPVRQLAVNSDQLHQADPGEQRLSRQL